MGNVATSVDRECPLAAKTFRRAANRRRLIAKKEAINFAMSLDVPQRRTVQLHLPGGDIAELPIIEQMYAQHQKNK
jgi:hypothetical protein